MIADHGPCEPLATGLAAWLCGQGVNPSQVSLPMEAHTTDHQAPLCWVRHHFGVSIESERAISHAAARVVAVDRARTSLGAPFWRTLAQCLEGNCGSSEGEFGNGLGAATHGRSRRARGRVDRSATRNVGRAGREFGRGRTGDRRARQQRPSAGVADRVASVVRCRSSCRIKGRSLSPWSR